MKDHWTIRNAIGISVILFGFTFVIICYILKPEENVMNVLLPVVATWVGTIIAFYFGKENFEAATKSFQEVIKSLTPEQKMASTLVRNVMIPTSRLSFIIFDEKTYEMPIMNIINKEGFEKYQRIAFITSESVFKYMIHKSTFALFLVDKIKDNKKNVNELTLQDMLGDSKIKKMLEKSVSFVSINSNLLEAKQAMDAIPECLDVFVTNNGNENEPILGLVTNNIVLENSKV
ncbi:MAG TPA: hypothetical protein PKY56_00610 [Candidatus Kapabacteria bacterium]|nr:hypothetical protein [Candidatus Kapabacteria bacterium]HPO61618.1 hypothetical protein [Candidatus Kapabacteria bacterium]